MITIRLLDAADAAPFQSLRLAAIRTSPTSFLPTEDEVAAVPVETFAAQITPTHTQAVFGAFDGETLIGSTGVRRDAHAKVAHKATIWGVYVDAAYRGRGIAQSLLEHAIGHAEHAWQCAQLMLCVNEFNAPRNGSMRRSVSSGSAPSRARCASTVGSTTSTTW
ncbi:hypothetical protein FEP12_04967 [Burkholderia multivorans]|nr:hypothetical protein [Burkholderia multivorans]MDR9178651.1 hypothetical protein [Burkholderia multivorans]MDR9186066.1 hypothetical protein [Burkholderia multivorans]MDR9194121.1 hypothetical protein [Burkholderia multivorans]MDR9199319.1 hypothetical protein [Burkholderia multivorans]